MKLSYPLIAVLVSAVVASVPSSVRAESTDLMSDRSAAADAYHHAQRAATRGDVAESARLYELADILAPSPQALRSAVRALLASRQDARAATNAALLLARYDDAASTDLAREVLDELEGDFLRVSIQCDERCRVSVGARASVLRRLESHVLFVAPGDHELMITFEDGSAISRSVAGGAGATVSMRVRRPTPILTTVPKVTTSAGLDRRWFTVSLVATVTLAGAAAWSHEEGFGERSTGLLLGGALGTAITTGVLALVTDWSPGHERTPRVPQLRVGTTRGGASLGLGGRF